MYVVGGQALKYLYPDYRETSDWDVWISDDPEAAELIGFTDYSILPDEVIDLISRENGENVFVNKDTLYTIKLSHLGWDIFFEKHKRDVLFLEQQGAKIILDLYEALVSYWKKEHGNKDFLSLYKDKTEFFNDHVDYIYDHDYLHELIAYPHKPVYTKCLVSGEDVAIDKEAFDKMSFQDQVKMFREEICVIAAERWLIPEKVCGKVSWQLAYKYSVRKTITQLTKNWATGFLVQNLKEFITPNYEEFEHLLLSIEEGEKIMGKLLNKEQSDMVWDDMLEAYNSLEPRYAFDSRVEFLFEEPSVEGLEWLEQEGGGEGGAEDCHTVFKFKDVVYKVFYSYYSYNGFSLYDDTLTIVEPKEKTITVYE